MSPSEMKWGCSVQYTKSRGLQTHHLSHSYRPDLDVRERRGAIHRRKPCAGNICYPCAVSRVDLASSNGWVVVAARGSSACIGTKPVVSTTMEHTTAGIDKRAPIEAWHKRSLRVKCDCAGFRFFLCNAAPQLSPVPLS